MKEIFFCLFISFCLSINAHENWNKKDFSQEMAHLPTPLPDRVILTWNDNPATTQSVNWRTDISIKKGFAQLAIANANGRTFKPKKYDAETAYFKSDINEAHYHNVTFKNLEENTLYAYRVGDGINWSEYYHFRTASSKEEPFSFIYFGDAQNEVKTHWSRVFREAFRDAPRAAFTLHAGDLVDEHDMDAQWGEWHQGPDWVNGTIPVIATPGNHEYQSDSDAKRIWKSKDGKDINIDIISFKNDTPSTFIAEVEDSIGQKGTIRITDSGVIISIDEGIEVITGFSKNNLINELIYGGKAPLYDRLRNQTGIKKISSHWRPQFSFPIQDVPDDRLIETVYYLDYQGVRFISLDSNIETGKQVAWLRKTLENNPNRWTIMTFHHPMYSPASNRDNKEMRQQWKPLLDEFKVDLVLSGHDHAYSRTGLINSQEIKNIPTGYQQAYDPKIGTVHVVSVSGPKMYKITKGKYAKKFIENTQLYQIIDIKKNNLRFRAYDATGKLYDEFLIQKEIGKPNLLIEN